MKKLISILIFGFICLVAYNQSTLWPLYPSISITGHDGGVWSFSHVYSAKDTIGVKQDSVTLNININTVDSLNPEIRVKITEIISPARVILQFQVRRSTNDSWTTVTAQSKLYTGVGTDTTMYIRNLTGYKAWPYQRLLFITNSATKVGAVISELSGYYKR